MPFILFRRTILALSCFVLGCNETTPSSPPDTNPPVDAGVEDATMAEDASPSDASSDAPDVDPTEDTPITPRFQALADTVEKERKQLGAPGVAVLVMEHGQTTFAHGFGSKDPDQDAPVKATTLFRLGSITKTLTATAALQQVEAGKLDLEAKMTDLVPKLNVSGGAAWLPSLHVRNLLSHTSGINDSADIYGKGAGLKDDWLAKYTNSGFAKDHYLMAAPDEMFGYSNPNYALAGYLVEQTSGTLYRTYMHDRVFAPLGMQHTFFLGTEVEADGDYATANTVNLVTGNPEKAGPTTYDHAWERPCGFAWTSIRDLSRFIGFLMHGDTKVLSDDLRMQMQTAQRSTKEMGDIRSYGFGLFVEKGALMGSPEQYFGMKVLSHSGAIPGYSAALWILPEQEFAFAILANTDDAYFPRSYAKALGTLATLPAAAPVPDEVNVDTTTFSHYEGTFQDDYVAGSVIVTNSQGTLTVQIPELDAQGYHYDSKLIPYYRDNFVLTIEGQQLVVTFLFDEAGQVEYMRSRIFVAKKAETSVKAATKAAPQLKHALPSALRSTREANARLRMHPLP